MEETKKIVDYFELLEVEQDATIDAVKKAFMAKALIWHPDKATSDQERNEFSKVYQDLQDAYRILSSESTRKMYMDSQQKTNLDFVIDRSDRDVSYQKSDNYTTINENGEKIFDAKSFSDAFYKTRDSKDDKLNDTSVKPINSDDIYAFMAKRDMETSSIETGVENLFILNNNKNFDNNSFNRMFDAMKVAKDVQIYSEPMGTHGGSLMETGLDLQNGMNFDAYNINNIIEGSVINPGMKISNYESDEVYGKEQKMSVQDTKALMEKAQNDRMRLLDLSKDAFIVTRSEIEEAYADLYRPLDVEGLTKD